MIQEYRFGSVVINNKTYSHDVEVRWTGQVLKWWRESSHQVLEADIERATKQKPDTIIIGTGASGMMSIGQECRELLEEKGIRLIEDATEEAVKTFNIILEGSAQEEGEQERVIGLFHLTC